MGRAATQYNPPSAKVFRRKLILTVWAVTRSRRQSAAASRITSTAITDPARETPKMQRKTANIDIRVEPRLIERIDAWRAQQRVPPSRSAALVYMIEEFLQQEIRPPA